ncbi:uncharacterized protein VTP21DRAFT_2809 [Calcarisporiella thermophila]|uniref:uncharacterized protein n=1 Tax=Calcarisporiella thermophila TaxID=911321 RepID=UPI0037424720
MEKSRGNEKSESSKSSRSEARQNAKDHLFSISTFILVAVVFLTLSTVGIIMHSFIYHQVDPKACAMTYMRPMFLEQTNFDSRWSRLADKYSLFLYREYGYDENEIPTGIPVLFIHGHAGSYKQVRSLAAESAMLYYDALAKKGFSGREIRNLDFFTLDFNEEYSALHGLTLLEQAEYSNDAIKYILSLYHPQSHLPAPTSVIIIAHSMGGIVARTLFVLPNFKAGSVNTLLTLTTPHLLPAMSLDRRMTTLYANLSAYWREGYQKGSGETLKEVTLVSIAGGSLDQIVASDAAGVESLVPPTHGFAVYATGIPQVWTGADHLSILWCNQLVKALSRCLLGVVDGRNPTKTIGVEERLRVFREELLGRWDNTLPLRLDSGWGEIRKETVVYRSLHSGPLRQLLPKDSSPMTTLLTVPSSGSPQFHLLTDRPLGSQHRLDLLLCTENDAPLECKSMAANTLLLPPPHSTGDGPLRFLHVHPRELRGYSYVAVVDRGGDGSDGFIEAEMVGQETAATMVRPTPGSLFNKIRFRINSRQIYTKIRVPSLNSLLSYRFRVLEGTDNATMRMVVRQSAPEGGAYESKFHVNSNQFDVAFHGPAPYALVPQERRGLILEFWKLPALEARKEGEDVKTEGEEEDLEVEMQVNVYGSLGRIVTRYRMVAATFPAAVLFLIFKVQLRWCRGFGESAAHALWNEVPSHIAFVSILAVLQANLSGNLASGWALRDMLLGIHDVFFWWLPGVLIVLSVGAVATLWGVVRILVEVLALLLGLLPRGAATPRLSLTWKLSIVGSLIAILSRFRASFFAILVGQLLLSAWTLTISKRTREKLQRFYHLESILLLMVLQAPFHLPLLPVAQRVPAIALALLQWIDPSPQNLMVNRTVQRMGTVLLHVVSAGVFVYGVRYAWVVLMYGNGVFLYLVLLHLVRLTRVL